MSHISVYIFTTKSHLNRARTCSVREMLLGSVSFVSVGRGCTGVVLATLLQVRMVLVVCIIIGGACGIYRK